MTPLADSAVIYDITRQAALFCSLERASVRASRMQIQSRIDKVVVQQIHVALAALPDAEPVPDLEAISRSHIVRA
jgi:hypothetical protein